MKTLHKISYFVLLVLLFLPVQYATAQVVTTLAGDGTAALLNGTGTAAQFSGPTGICTDGAGNLYVADLDNHCICRIVIATGVVTTLAGGGTPGFNDAVGLAALFNNPSGICYDGVGTLFVADRGNHCIRRLVIATGLVTTLAGSTMSMSGFMDATGTMARFNAPSGVCFDGGNLYVADFTNQRIRRINIATGFVATLAGQMLAGFADGIGTVAQFSSPAGICTDGAGNLFVTDFGGNRIRRIVIATANVTTLAGNMGGFADGTGAAAQFQSPSGVCMDGAGALAIADMNNNRIRRIDIATGVVTTLAGNMVGFADGTGAAAQFASPFGICSISAGNFFVADRTNNRIRRIAPSSLSLGITSFTPTSGSPGTTVIITGSGFTGATTVSFSGVPAASFTVNSDTQITAVVGSGSLVSGGQQLVIVSSPTGLSTLSGFFVGTSGAGASGSAASGVSIPQSAVLGSFSTSNLSFGVPITLSGSGFTGATGLLIGGVPVTNFVVVNDGIITATVGGVPINDRVMLTGSASASADMSGLGLHYNRLPPPRIIVASPASFQATGEEIPLAFSGADFLTGARVQVSDGRVGLSAGVRSVTASALETNFPGALQSIGTKTVTIMNPDGQTTSTTLTVTLGAAPQLRAESLTRSSTASGSAFSVRLVGAGIFRTATAWLNDAPARVTVPSSTEAIVEIPASLNDVGGITLALRITNTDGQSTNASVRINRRPPPTILGVALHSGGILRVRGEYFMVGLRAELGVSNLTIRSQEGDTALTAQIPPTFRLVPNSPTIAFLVENPDRRAHGIVLPRSMFESNVSFQTALGTEQYERVWENTTPALEITEVIAGKQIQSGLQELHIYPNPMEGELRIGGMGVRIVRVYDMCGGVVLEDSTATGVVNVSALGTGAYMVVVEADGGRVLRQRVVKR